MAKNQNPDEIVQEDPQKKKWVKPTPPPTRQAGREESNPNKILRERVQFENAQIKRERDRQRQIQMGKRQGWVNPNLYTPQERHDRWLESKGLLNYQQSKIFPTVPIETSKQIIPSGGNADRPVNFVQGENGLLIRAPKPVQTVSDSPLAPTVFASVKEARDGQANWTDVAVDERKQLLSNPDFYKSGQITTFPKWMQQQILNDPNFEWDRLPAWQRTYYDLSSSPATMGAVQGTLMGLGSGSPFGAPMGAALGFAAAKSGYDQTKEFWKQDNAIAGAFGLFNWLAEQAEKGTGLLAQSAAILTGNDPNFDPHKRNLSWDAGAGIAEVLGPAYQAALKADDGKFTAEDILNRVPIVAMYRLYQVISDPEKFKGREAYLGAEKEIPLDQSWIERLNEAEKRINKGEPYREVMADLQTGVKAQLSDMVFQAAADPLNILPEASTKILGLAADANGYKVAATALEQSGGLVEAGRKYRTLVQSGQALTIDPNFKMHEMSDLARFIAGVNDKGEVKAGSIWFTKKGLLDPVTKNKTGWLEDMVTQTPHSRAQTGAGMFYENMATMLQMFETPEEAKKYLTSLSNNDMQTWADFGSRFAESPEFYTILPALRDFIANDLDGISQMWEMTTGNRDMLVRVADIMGDQPGNVLEDLASRGTAEQDFARILQKAQESNSPIAKALLADVEAGRFTAETLKQMVDVFTGDGALPWHPGQWKALMLDQLGDHFDKWVTQRLMLDKSPEAQSAFYRTSALMKQAQSILLLGGSPGYAITNGLSNMVHRAVSGVFGYMTGRQIDSFMERFGVTPARFEEGVGIGGQTDLTPSPSPKGEGSRVVTSEMDKAVRGKGPLTTAKDALAKISRGMPFSKLSSWFERTESRQAFSIAMKDAWSQSWRRGVGFREMSPELVRVLTDMNVDPKRIYAAIEAGMNQNEIESILRGRQGEVQARSLIHDAAEKTGMTASDAAQMLERIGILDTLDQFLKGQTTRDGVKQAFRRAERVAQDWIDMRTGEDLKAQAEYAKQRIGLEGVTAGLDVFLKAHAEYTEIHMDHYYRMGEVMNDLFNMPDEAMRSKAVDYAYEVSGQEFRRIDAKNAANFKGVMDVYGFSGDPRALRLVDAIGEAGKAMGDAYTQSRENLRQWRQRWAGDLKNPARWDDFAKVQAENKRLFEQGFKGRHDAQVKQGLAMRDIYEEMHGPAAGEAALKWWEDVVAFNDEMVKKEQAFRESLNEARRSGVPAEDIAAQKQKYYSETKILQIAELEKINSEGIARLERVIKGGGSSQLPVTSGPVPPVDGGGVDVGQRSQVAGQEVSSEIASATPRNDGADEVNALMAAAEQRKGRDAAEKAARVSAVWDVAEEYWGKGGNYNRGILQDRFALLNALRKPEYGGVPDLFDLSDERLTPEMTRQVLENRKAAKETNAAAAAEQAFTVTEKNRGKKFDTSQINNDTTILRAIALHGGLDLNLAKDITGEVKPKGVPGLFTRKGLGIDEIARMLADDGYPIRIDDPNDIGGMQQTRDLINRARGGDKVYPMGHDFSSELSAAEQAWIDGFNFDNVPEVPFDTTLWQTAWENAVQFADLGKVFELIGDFPNERLDTPAPSGETWREYLSRVSDETAVRAAEDATAEKVAGHAAQAEESMRVAEERGAAREKRTVLLESLADAFKLDEQQTAAYGELSDAVAGWYARMTGESVDEFYNRYFGEVRKGSDQVPGASDQSLMQNVDGSQIPGEYHKGMVTFEDMKGTITAFEKGDFSTVIHETGHIYRRMMADVAERTQNPSILRDLQTVEEWAGVKDGKWTREAEEKFARGFERYIAEGNAPTPKLVRAFESFRRWMLDIYKTIMGSAIDVKLTDDVKQVFDRMLGQEDQRVSGIDPETQWVDTNGKIYMKARADLEMDPNAAKTAKADAQALMASDLGERLKAAREARRRAQSNLTPSPSTLTAKGEGSVDSLFQSEVPFGVYEEKAQFRPGSDGLDEGWRTKVMPLLQAMESGASDQLTVGGGELGALPAEGQTMLKKYMQQVKGEMATTKLATIRFAEKQRDFAMLNYSKRYGIDRMAEFYIPYELYPTRSGVNWLARVVDKPALFSNYARGRMQQDRYQRDIPERLRGKIRIKAPWLPEWMGNSLYIDPMRNLFFPDTVARYLERGQQDKNYQLIEAERVLQEWRQDGKYSEAEISQAQKTREGKVWERAFAEAQLRRESETSNPVDFFTSFFGPAWWIAAPLNLAGVKAPGIPGKPEKVSTLPLGNTARALDTVTDGTWAEPFGNLLGLIGRGEDAIRKSLDLPARGELGEYYTKKQVALMVAEGRVSPEDAQVAMIEKTGAIWEEAQKRVDMELAMRVPLAAETYAALHGGAKAAAQAAVPSLFGASLLPQGELEYRGLKGEWDQMWKLVDAGDKDAKQRFFDAHPEYEAWLAKNKDDGELLKSFLISQIWDSYMALGATNKKQAEAELGNLFSQSFLDNETRSYDTLDVNQLAEWARMLGARVPNPTPLSASQTSPQTLPRLGGEAERLQLYPQDVTDVTDTYFAQRQKQFPNWYEEQSGYFDLPKSERKSYLLKHPDLVAYWKFNDKWTAAYPEYEYILKGKAFKRVDTSGWMPGLEDAVREAAFNGGRLPSGAQKALMNEWLLAGKPMDDFDTWVKSVVMPGMMYGN